MGDMNKDNHLSFEEVAAQAKVDMPKLADKGKYADFEKRLTKVFKKADANGAGFVDRAELPVLEKSLGRQAKENEEQDEVMKSFDMNKDNHLSFDEVAAQAKVDMPKLADKDTYAD